MAGPQLPPSATVGWGVGWFVGGGGDGEAVRPCLLLRLVGLGGSEGMEVGCELKPLPPTTGGSTVTCAYVKRVSVKPTPSAPWLASPAQKRPPVPNAMKHA